MLCSLKWLLAEGQSFSIHNIGWWIAVFQIGHTARVPLLLSARHFWSLAPRTASKCRRQEAVVVVKMAVAPRALLGGEKWVLSERWMTARKSDYEVVVLQFDDFVWHTARAFLVIMCSPTQRNRLLIPVHVFTIGSWKVKGEMLIGLRFEI